MTEVGVSELVSELVVELVVGRDDRVVVGVAEVLVDELELIGVKSVPTAAVPPVVLLQLTMTASSAAVLAAMKARRSCWVVKSASILRSAAVDERCYGRSRPTPVAATYMPIDQKCRIVTEPARPKATVN